jgi:hypothetical protein
MISYTAIQGAKRMGVYRGGKDTTDCYHALDVRWLYRKRILERSCSTTINWHRGDDVIASIGVRNQAGNLEIEYTHTGREGERTRYCYSVEIEWTRCNYGGTRPWFRCPARDCGRRVAVLYGGRAFACRQCQNLVYECQHEAPHYGALDRFHKIIRRLGGQPGCGIPPKPKGMHWRTYERLSQDAERAHSMSFPPWLIRRLLKT